MVDIGLVAPKLSKLIPLLSSDQDGEVVATVRAIGRTLKSAGLDLHDLAKAVTAPKSVVVGGGNAQPDPEPRPKTLHDIAVWCRTHGSERLNFKEREFVSEMAGRLSMDGRISSKQENWLRSIFYQIGGEYVP